ncbi:MAG: HAMP domain-containing histidine kinase [Chitinophagales bacterium]|nr:HAMP domain-containing histidine kinase [Chitinophagales bacterium]
MQIKTKLTLTYFFVTALLLFLALMLIYLSFKGQMEKQFYLSLRTNALMTLSMIERSDYGFNQESLYGADEKPLLNVKDNILIYNDRDQLVFSFMEEPLINQEILDKIQKDGEYLFPLGPYKAIGINYQTPGGKQFVLIGKGEFISEELKSLQGILVWTFIVFLLITAIAGYFNARRAMLPIQRVIQDMDNILPDQLSARIYVGPSQDEIAHLATAFNDLLARIEEAFNIQKGFLSFISHEVRNPLASIISRIEVHTMKERTIEEYKNCLTPILKDARELEQMASQLMQLTRITAGAEPIEFKDVRLDELIWDIIRSIKSMYPEYQIQVDTSELPEDADQFILLGNEILLKTAIANLIENACKYSSDHAAFVRIYFESPGRPMIDIVDHATIIPDEEKALLFKPFYRSNTHKKIKGSGIGLALVALIMKVHNFPLVISTDGVSGNIFTLKFFSER